MKITPAMTARTQYMEDAAIQRAQTAKAAQAKKAAKAATKPADKNAAAANAKKADNKAAVTNKKPNYRPDKNKIARMKAQFSQQTKSFADMVNKMLSKQASKADRGANLKDLFSQVVVSPQEQAAAIEAISENGYWGVNKTSERILEFAKSLSGGDPAKIDELKSAFKRGFDQVKRMFGGELPDISQKTYDKVMEGFDTWEKGETPKAEAPAGKAPAQAAKAVKTAK